MSDSNDLERRLSAVERAVDGDIDPANTKIEDREALETRLESLESRVDELDAAVQAIRGFLGGVSAVNEAVERRADAAVAAVERLEARLDGDASVAPDLPDDGDESAECGGQSSLRERLRGHR